MKGFVAGVLGLLVAAWPSQAAWSEILVSPPKEAEFRSRAMEMLKSLQMPSCQTKGLQAPTGFRRVSSLEPEQAAVREFEEQIKGTPAQFYFDVAKADAEFELTKNEDCWAEYDDLQVANRHLEMTRADVKSSLERLDAIAPSLTEAPQTNLPSADAAAFRYLVRNLVESSRPRCQVTSRAENDVVSAPARAEVARFKARLKHSEYAAHFSIAEADVAYYYSIVHVECDDPGEDPPSKVSQRFLSRVKSQIAAIERRFALR